MTTAPRTDLYGASEGADTGLANLKLPPSVSRSRVQVAAKSTLTVLDRLVEFVAAGLLAAIIAIVFAGVIARYAFNASFAWTEELASWTFVWLTFVGVAAGHRGERHIAIGILNDSSSPGGKELVRSAVDVVVAYTTIMLLVGGSELIESIGGISTGLQWPNFVKYLMIPASCLISIAYLVFRRVSDEGGSIRQGAIPVAIAGILYAITSLAWSGPPLPNVSPTLIMSVAFAASMILGVPVGFSMLFSVFLSTWGADLLPVTGVVHSMVGGASPFVLLAIPFFLAAGYLMNSGGLSARIIDFASALVGHWRGGLAQANVVHSVMLGGICGSSSADAASTTKILVPEMVKRGYSGPFACAVTAVGSILPACFPPSIALLIYASIAEVSVAQLFTAGIVPGLVLAATMIATVHFVAVRRNYEPSSKRASLRQVGNAGMRALPALALAFAILGLLRFGVVTATEVGVVAFLWSLILGKFVYRGFTWREFYRDMAECAVDSALIGFLIAVSAPFAWVLIAEQVPQLLADWSRAAIAHPMLLLLFLNIVLLIAGTFLEIIPIMLIVIPLFGPLMIAAGVDPIHLGVVIVVNGMLGAVTPPVGILVFICASIAKVPASAVFRECNPFLVACGVGLLIITYFPSLSLTLWKIIGH